jgi:hypothetical protein
MIHPQLSIFTPSLLFAGDTSIIIYHPDTNCFQNSVNDVFTDVNKWFKANKVTSNFYETNFMKFAANNRICISLKIGYGKTIEVLIIKFPASQIDNTLNWKKHIEYTRVSQMKTIKLR